MDDPDADPELLGNALRFLRRVNRFFGYTRATLAHLRGFSRRWMPGEKIRILDLGTGSADIPLAILSWAERAGFDMYVMGLDLHARTVAAAARQAIGNPRLKIVCGDVLEMPLANGAFDYALANMFLHHLDDEQVVEVLRRMDALATRGIIFADLIRSRSAYHAVRLSTMLSNRMVYRRGGDFAARSGGSGVCAVSPAFWASICPGGREDGRSGGNLSWSGRRG
jgi:SAM-dependent methyltransferase